MENLITVNKVIHAGESISSVNARDIHTFLEVKTPFSMWIQRAIEKFGFVENDDFTINTFVNGKATQNDYIVLVDMAKELAMLENNPKGKEVRKYFIEVEKELIRTITPKTPLDAVQIMLNEHKALDSRVHDLEHNVPVNNQQQNALLSAKNSKVYSMINQHPREFKESDARKLHRRVWQLFKKRFNLPRYNELPNGSFSDGIYFINNITFGDML